MFRSRITRSVFLFLSLMAMIAIPFSSAMAITVESNATSSASSTVHLVTTTTTTVTKTTKTTAPKAVVTAPVAKPYERIFYYTGGATAEKDFLAHGSQIDIFAPQAYSLDSNGVLTGSIDPTLLNFAEVNHIKVMPLVTNGSFSSSTIAEFLDNPTTQDSAIDEMLAEAKLYGYNGWQLDFEQMPATYRDAFSIFAAKFGSIMKENGLISSIAVVAQVSQNPGDYPGNLWQNLIGVYDYPVLGQDVDFLSVMSYDDPNSKGPIAEYAWFQKVIAYSVSMVPADKISLGLGLYYWQWNTKTTKLVGIGGNSGIQNVFAKHYVSQFYSALQQEPYLTYTTKGIHYQIWFENAQSIQKKLALIKAYGLRGFSAWSLGLEVPSVWTVIRKGNKEE